MSGAMDTAIKLIAETAIEEAIKNATNDMIEEHAGFGIESYIKTEIKAAAKEILSTREIREQIKERIQYWIAKQ